MNPQIKPWMVVTTIRDSIATDVGVILDVNEEANTYRWAPYPRKSKSGRRTRHHLRPVQQGDIQTLEQQIDAHQVTLREQTHVGLQAMSVAEVEEVASNANDPRSSTYQTALQIMREQWSWIEPFVRRAGAGIEALIDKSAVTAHARKVAQAYAIAEGTGRASPAGVPHRRYAARGAVASLGPLRGARPPASTASRPKWQTHDAPG